MENFNKQIIEIIKNYKYDSRTFNNLSSIHKLCGQFKDNINPHSSKEEYLNWVFLWKVFYKEISRMSKLSKLHRKTKFIQKHYTTDPIMVSAARSYDIVRLKDIATKMIELRQSYKVVVSKEYKNAA